MATALTGDQAASILQTTRERAGLSLRELARRAGTSHATLLAYEQGRKTPSVATFVRILEACGFAVDIDLSPRVRSADGLDRGRELAQVLELAARFPAKPKRTLDLPRFGQVG